MFLSVGGLAPERFDGVWSLFVTTLALMYSIHMVPAFENDRIVSTWTTVCPEATVYYSSTVQSTR